MKPCRKAYEEFIEGLTAGLDMRGHCADMTDCMVGVFPELRRVRGHYYCPIADREHTHWWCVDTDGMVIDPTAAQFQSRGAGEYREYVGPEPAGKCIYCGDLVLPPCSTFCDENCAADWIESESRAGSR